MHKKLPIRYGFAFSLVSSVAGESWSRNWGVDLRFKPDPGIFCDNKLETIQTKGITFTAISILLVSYEAIEVALHWEIEMSDIL